MALEIERKYLVVDDSYKALSSTSYIIKQGYLSRRKEATVRVRIRGDKAYVTIKGVNHGIVRSEWEYSIPVDDAEAMLSECCEPPVISKTRYIVDYAGRTWEVDEFHGPLEGLVVAEVELENPGSEVKLPGFTGEEVTGDARYYNSNLGSSIPER